MSYLTEEIASQPGRWSAAIEMAGAAGSALPAPGERVAAIGCGSSLNVARCYAAVREAAGQGETDVFPASEVPAARRYDRLVYISRTGTTTEVLDALRHAPAPGPSPTRPWSTGTARSASATRTPSSGPSARSRPTCWPTPAAPGPP